MKNPDCMRCGGDNRQTYLTEGLCDKVKSMQDGLPVRCVGPWAYEKVYYLFQYLNIFLKGMKNKWDSFNYIEICCGPGICINKDTREEIEGTALANIALLLDEKVNHVLFLDLNPDVIDALKQRIERKVKCLDLSGEQKDKLINKFKYKEADYNDPSLASMAVDLIASSAGSALNLVFIDPTDASVPFELIRQLQQRIRMDLIINVAMGTDINRNLVQTFINPSLSNLKQKYINFLGSSEFFENDENKALAEIGDNLKLRSRFITEYKSKLHDIGMNHVDYVEVEHYYYLLFASSHKRGLDFWKKSHRIGPDGQRTLDF